MPWPPFCLRLLADFHLNNHEFEAARDYYLQLLNAPEQIEKLPLFNNLAAIALALNELTPASDFIERARRLAPMDPYTLDNLGWL